MEKYMRKRFLHILWFMMIEKGSKVLKNKNRPLNNRHSPISKPVYEGGHKSFREDMFLPSPFLFFVCS